MFLDLAASGTAILFSTHITTDLEKCADDITYIREGRIKASCTLKDFLSGYRMLELHKDAEIPAEALGVSRTRTGAGVLLGTENAARLKASDPGREIREAGLEEIMIHLEKGMEAE